MKKGFTIIEVIVVIGIIAILTVIIFPSIDNIRKKNRDTERIADMAAIRLGLEQYKNGTSTNQYPVNLEELLTYKYVTQDSLTTPDGGSYLYVPLKKGDNRCSYFHLGIQLELPNAQIDSDDLVDSTDPDGNNTNISKYLLNPSEGYTYCGGYAGPGIDPTKVNMYQIHSN